MTAAWYIDAWAVRDGVAFASHRPPGSIDATNTVFMSVPSLEPIPVGRISTALRATRGSFQAGFHDDEGDEIPFDDLGQVREVIRRAYLASGIGLDGTAGARLVAPRPEPGAGGGAYYEPLAGTPSLGWVGWYDERLGPAESLRALNGDRTGLVHLVSRFAEATLVEWELALAAVDVESVPSRELQRFRRGLYEWYGRLVAIDTWNGADAMHHFTAANDCHVGQQLVDRFGYDHLVMASWHNRHYSDQELLAMAPCPLRETWAPGITRLSDKLYLSLSASDYFPANASLANLAPVLLTAAVGLPEADYVHPGGDRFAQLDARISDALQWLAREAPSVDLPPIASLLLDRYAWARLDDPEPEATPPHPQPEPAPVEAAGEKENPFLRGSVFGDGTWTSPRSRVYFQEADSWEQEPTGPDREPPPPAPPLSAGA